MITKESMDKINKAIKQFNIYIGKTFLLFYKRSKKDQFSFFEIKMEKYHFWHIVGCKYAVNSKLSVKDKDDLYTSCLNGEDISLFLDYTHDAKSVTEKTEAIEKVFDFIHKSVSLANTKNTTQERNFEYAIGNENAYIGYDNKDYGKILKFYFPRSAQKTTINRIVDYHKQDTIYIILSKKITDLAYNKIEYQYPKNIFLILGTQIKQNHLDKKYILSADLIKMIDDYNSGGGSGQTNAPVKKDNQKSNEKEKQNDLNYSDGTNNSNQIDDSEITSQKIKQSNDQQNVIKNKYLEENNSFDENDDYDER